MRVWTRLARAPARMHRETQRWQCCQARDDGVLALFEGIRGQRLDLAARSWTRRRALDFSRHGAEVQSRHGILEFATDESGDLWRLVSAALTNSTCWPAWPPLARRRAFAVRGFPRPLPLPEHGSSAQTGGEFDESPNPRTWPGEFSCRGWLEAWIRPRYSADVTVRRRPSTSSRAGVPPDPDARSTAAHCLLTSSVSLTHSAAAAGSMRQERSRATWVGRWGGGRSG